MISRYKMIWLSLLILLIITTTLAQETCDAIVQQAIETASENCDGLRRNEACYGNVTIDAEAAPDVEDFTFDTAGDIANVSDIASMRLSSDLDNGDWGISLMQLRASLPDTTQDNVTVVLFGNVTAENTVTGDTIEVTTNSRTRIRRTPDSRTDLNIIDALEAGMTMTAYGRSESGDWLRISWNGIQAWIGAITVDGDSERMSLPIVDFSAPFMGPMQAFYLSHDDNTTNDCEDNAVDGILIQTPEGTGTIDFMINEVRVSLGSIAFIELQDSTLSVSLLEGLGTVRAENEEVFVPNGTQTMVTLDASTRSAISPPTEVQFYDADRLRIVEEVVANLMNATITLQTVSESQNINDYIEEARSQIDIRGGNWTMTLISVRTVEDTLQTQRGASACTLNASVGFNVLRDFSYDADAQIFDSAPLRSAGIYGASDNEHNAVLAPNSASEVSEFVTTYTFNSPTSFTRRTSFRNNWVGGGTGEQYFSACVQYWRGTYVGE